MSYLKFQEMYFCNVSFFAINMPTSGFQKTIMVEIFN